MIDALQPAGIAMVFLGGVLDGLCLEPEVITAYGLEGAAQKFPCRN